MAYDDLRSFLETQEKEGRFVRYCPSLFCIAPASAFTAGAASPD